MEIDYKKISRMTNMELLEYLEHINENDLQDVLEFVLFNLDKPKFGVLQMSVLIIYHNLVYSMKLD